MNEEISIILSKAKALVEAAFECEECEELDDAKEKLEDVIDVIEDVIDSCEGSKKKSDKDDDIDESTKEVVNEAIDALYSKAILCESAEEAEIYIAKAEELEGAI